MEEEKIKKALIIIIIALVIFIIWIFIIGKNKDKVYYAENFGIATLLSKTDYDKDGIDDYTDILQGARRAFENREIYRIVFYNGGYPPNNEGGSADIIWRALQSAGYNLKELMDADIAENTEEYSGVSGRPNPNIDFRKISNIKTYFERNELTLTTDLELIEEWQPGDIVVFGNTHIGIISDKRNNNGIPYLIHDVGQEVGEENILETYSEYKAISGHYRMK